MIHRLPDLLLRAACVGVFLVGVAGRGDINDGEAKIET
jgi:hypothetical protein